MPSKSHVVYEKQSPTVGSLATLALQPWALAAHAMRLWATVVTSAVRR